MNSVILRLCFLHFMKKACPWFTGFLHVSWEYARQTDHRQTFVRSATLKKERAVTTRLRVTLPKFATLLVMLIYEHIKTIIDRVEQK